MKKITLDELIDYLDLIAWDDQSESFDTEKSVNFMLDFDLLNLNKIEIKDIKKQENN